MGKYAESESLIIVFPIIRDVSVQRFRTSHVDIPSWIVWNDVTGFWKAIHEWFSNGLLDDIQYQEGQEKDQSKETFITSMIFSSQT
jgi:hypothetical protein